MQPDVNALVARLVDTLAEHLYALAESVPSGESTDYLGDGDVQDTYMDAADALMDVAALWQEEGL